MNSETAQQALIRTCKKTITLMQHAGLAAMPNISGYCKWHDQYGEIRIYNFLSQNWDRDNRDYTLIPQTYIYQRNSYDSSLTWIVSYCNLDLRLERTKVTATEATYQVSCKFSDRFDFNSDSNSGFKDLISGIGAAFFKEFDWESSVTFQLKVPYSCTHSSGNYHWTYDKAQDAHISDRSNGFSENKATLSKTQDYGKGSGYYDEHWNHWYELEHGVRLRHDNSWVLEYDVKNPGKFAFSPLQFVGADSMFRLYQENMSYLFLQNRDLVLRYNRLSVDQHDYGSPLSSLFPYSQQETYAIRLENQVNPSGSNMPYLTVRNTSTGEVLLDKVAMDDYYLMNSEKKIRTFQRDGDTGLSGKDLVIGWIGSDGDTFDADYFDLRIWENGENATPKSTCTTKVTKPTCTKQGYTTYTCSHCGYSYQGDKTKATGHSYSSWETLTAATCTESGEEQRTCKTCNASETRITSATGHSFGNHICIGCGKTEYIPGDVDRNEIVDVDDVLALLWNVLFPEEYPIEVEADFDGNGSTDVDDVLTLLWYVLFPEDYPLNLIS